MSQKFVSVIIPVYNSASYISTAVDSVLNQSYKNLEIIIVDDGSEDNIGEAIEKYGHKVRYICQKNEGPAAARNLGIRNAAGDLIAFLDSDDEWLPQKLELSVRYMENESIGMVFSSALLCSKTNDALMEYKCSMNSTSDIRRSLLRECSIILPTVVVRKAVLDNVGVFNEDLLFGEDWELFYRIARKHSLKAIDIPLVRILRRKNSMTRDKKVLDRLINNTIFVINTIYSYPENIRNYKYKNIACNKFFRELADSELFECDTCNAKKHLYEAIRYKPTDVMSYNLLLKSFLWKSKFYTQLREMKSIISRSI